MGSVTEFIHFINLPKEKEAEWENKYAFIELSPQIRKAKEEYRKGLKQKNQKMEEEIIQGDMFD